MQSGINDRVKSIEEMINQMTTFLSEKTQIFNPLLFPKR